MAGSDKSSVIRVLCDVPAERLTPEFEAVVNRLTTGMGGFNKSSVISALRRVPAERLESFEAVVNRLTVGKDGFDKLSVINDLLRVPAERLTQISAALPDNGLATAPTHVIRSLIINMCNEPDSSVYSGLINRTLADYAHIANGAHHGPHSGIAFQIHNYADAPVSAPTTNTRPGSPTTLNNAVFSNIKTRIQGTNLISEVDTINVVRKMIFEDYESIHSGCTKFIMDAISNSASDKEALRYAYSFVKKFYPTYLKAWLQSFAGESLEAYVGRNNPTSCIKGVKERIITGLRVLNDPELTSLFSQAEGPLLVNKFMSDKMNPTKPENAERIAVSLKNLGVNTTTLEPEVRKKIIEYLQQEVINRNVDPKTQSKLIETVALTLIDFYDTIIKPEIKKLEDLKIEEDPELNPKSKKLKTQKF